MKISTFFTFAALFAAQQAATAQVYQQLPARTCPTLNEAAPVTSLLSAAPAKVAGEIWRPATEQIFYRNSAGTDWDTTPATTYTYTYDEAGNIKTKLYVNLKNEVENERYERYSYEYDEDGNVTVQTHAYSADGETWQSYDRTTMKYDNIVKGVQTEAMQYQYSTTTGDFTRLLPDNCFRKDIQRDADGKVTLLTVYKYDSKGKEYVYQRLTPTYDAATGHPHTILVEDQVYNSSTDGYELGEMKRFTNLTWQDCDDQFVDINAGYRIGKNRSLTFRYWYQGYAYGDYVMTYGEKAPEYDATYTYLDGSGNDVFKCSLVDDNGSYKIEDTSWWDKNGDGAKTDDEIAYSRYAYYYNERGKLVGEEQWGGGYGDALTLYYAHKDDYTFSTDYDYQTEIVSNSWDFFTPVLSDGSVNWQPTQRTLYSDFSKVGESTSVKGLADTAAGYNSYTLYDMQGRVVEQGELTSNARIANGQHGVFVMKMSNGQQNKSISIVK